MLRLMETIIIVGVLALMVYGGAVMLFPSAVPVMARLGEAQSVDVPSQINHQGVVSVNGVRFTGTGSFKFALMNAGNVIVWTNDGNQPNPPVTSVSLSVTDGVYSVRLGDTGLGMASIPSSIFADGGVKLRIWFNDNQGHGESQLTPDYALTSAAYAFNVADNAVTSAKIADGAIGNADISGSAAIAYSKLSGVAAASHAHSGADITSGTVADARIADTIARDTEVDGKLAARVPIGTIVMWYGSVASIPQGWSLCNGQTVNGYQTPNLVDKFVLGAAASGSPAPAETGGSKTITEANLPAHIHALSGSTGAGTQHSHAITGATAGESSHTHGLNNHTHSFSDSSSTTSSAGDHYHQMGNQTSFKDGSYGRGTGAAFNYWGTDGWGSSTFNTRTTGAHTHTVSVSGTTGGNTGNTAAGSSHSHGVGTLAASDESAHTHALSGDTGSVGSGADYRQPYYVLCFIMRTE